MTDETCTADGGTKGMVAQPVDMDAVDAKNVWRNARKAWHSGPMVRETENGMALGNKPAAVAVIQTAHRPHKARADRAEAALRAIWEGTMKDYSIQVRLTQAERDTLDIAADTAGLTVSAWLRSRLRKTARNELQSCGVQVPFLKDSPLLAGDAGRYYT